MRVARLLATSLVVTCVGCSPSATSEQTRPRRVDSVDRADPRSSPSDQLTQQQSELVSPSHGPIPSESDSYTVPRHQMVDQQLAARGITDSRVLDAMRQIPRHLFVSQAVRDRAYQDGPLPIGHDQTISQPYIVALMTQLARPTPASRALDVGTGSGYQAAVLSLLCRDVFSIEIVQPLAAEARERLEQLGFRNVTVRHGDGYRGWPEEAPFDLIIVAAAPPRVPQPLIDQLKPHGRLIVPVGRQYQDMMMIEKLADGTTRQVRGVPVSFVPMTGEVLQRDRHAP